MLKVKDNQRILKAARERQLIYTRLSADFSVETLQARRQSHDILKVLKGKKKNFQPRILSLTKLSFTIKGEINSFIDKQKQNEFINIKTVIQEMLK